MNRQKIKSIMLLIATTIVAFIFWPVSFMVVITKRPYWFRRFGYTLCFFIFALINTYSIIDLIYRSGEIEASKLKWEQTVSEEEARDYFIEIDDLPSKPIDHEADIIEVACDLKLKNDTTQPKEDYPNQLNTLQCAKHTVKGTFSHYDSTRISSTPSSHIHGEQNQYNLELKRVEFSKDDWEKKNIDYERLKTYGLSQTIRIEVINEILDGAVMSNRTIRIIYKFSDEDLVQIKQLTQAYQDHIAAKKAEADAKEEKERLEKEQAENKNGNTSTAPSQPQPSTTTPSPAPAPAPASTPPPAPPAPPAPTTNLPLKAICKDGTVSYQNDPSKQDYRGMCSHHGGIQTKLGRVP